MAATINKGNKSGYNGNKDKREVIGYLNIYAPGQNGRRKVGAIFLYEDDVSQAALAEYLAKDGANAAKLHGICEFEYNANKPDEDKMFVLPD